MSAQDQLEEQLKALQPRLYRPFDSPLSACTLLSVYDVLLTSFPIIICKLTQLKNLEVGGNRLSNLPASISCLGCLEVFCASSNEISALPAEISALHGLQELDIKNNRLSCIPSEISRLLKLKNLNISNNQLSVLPSNISALTGLSSFNISSNCFPTLPTSLFALTGLQNLFLSNNQLSELPASISRLTGLKLLYLYSNQLSSLPSKISTLTTICELYIYNNGFTSFPPEIMGLTRLSSLYLEDNEELPPGITALKCLRELRIESEQAIYIKSGPHGITSLPCWNNTNKSIFWMSMSYADALRTIHLYDPAEYWAKKILSPSWSLSEYNSSIDCLNFAGMNIMSLPDGISLLNNLRELSIYNNPIEDIPPWIVSLENLKILLLEDPKAWFPKISIKRAPSGLSSMPCWNKSWRKKIALCDNMILPISQPIAHPRTPSNTERTEISESQVNMKPAVNPPTSRFSTRLERNFSSGRYADILTSNFKQRANMIGKGGFGLVFKAELKAGTFAVKLVANASLYKDTSDVDPEKEGELMMRLKHPNIISMFDFGYIGDDLVFIMEFADGGDLCSLIKKMGALGTDLSMKYGQQIIRGLNYLHSQAPPIQHRDLKTENVLIANGVAKLTDFGLSKGGASVNSVSGFKGSKKWSPPEAFDVGKSMGLPSDVYSFGVIFWSMLAGKYPYEGMADREFASEVISGRFLPLPSSCPANLATLIHECWNRDYERRITAAQVDVELARVIRNPSHSGVVTQKKFKDMSTAELEEYLRDRNVNADFIGAVKTNEVTGADFIHLSESDLVAVPFNLTAFQAKIIMRFVQEAKNAE